MSHHQPAHRILLGKLKSVKLNSGLFNLLFVLGQKLHKFRSFHHRDTVNHADVGPGQVEGSVSLSTFCFVKDIIAVSGKVNPLVDNIDSIWNFQFLEVFKDLVAIRRVPGTNVHE
ncbi:predicted protein [Methanosarcina acetivorans C2A]|uniref:Uncharacterized protein n=1 Tax=Methanosarcina acetivorans (strain ATCC 35395 / DSM 2834 / JCM 12185 / C2A) TaxID=188937 RepID=Q8TIR2_METAC|nr:predicted protein [Methanosarcina acetivorans C2A]